MVVVVVVVDLLVMVPELMSHRSIASEELANSETIPENAFELSKTSVPAPANVTLLTDPPLLTSTIVPLLVVPLIVTLFSVPPDQDRR
jgi:hypothetical protein